MKFNKTLKAMMMPMALLAMIAAAPMAANAAAPTSQLLHKGMHNTDIKPLQTQLKKFNYYHDPIDGVFGPLTNQAVKEFQKDHGLDVDGIAGPDTIKSLKKVKSLAHTYKNAPLLKQGSHGKIVKKLQNQLQTLDFYHGDLDGIYGSLTESAVKDFQKANHIDVDGITGPATYQALIHNPVRHQIEKSKTGKVSDSKNPSPQSVVESTSTAPKKSSNRSEKVSRGADDHDVKTLVATSTAYTADCSGCSGVTTTGINLLKNPGSKVIAVDPSVIPLGSKVWVQGYGYAIAGDTGGAINGNRIDVFIPNHSKAVAWGRKTVKVKVFH
jgi:3D (Asp-Asp-Asp) domain-containing protein